MLYRYIRPRLGDDATTTANLESNTPASTHLAAPAL